MPTGDSNPQSSKRVATDFLDLAITEIGTYLRLHDAKPELTQVFSS